MEITDLINPQQVVPVVQASDKPQLLRELSERAGRALGIESQTILDALRSREMLGSTGIGHGIALPHACITGLDRFLGLFARLERPINFDAIDDLPVDLVFLLLLPEQAGNDHLAALACVSRRLRGGDVAARLRTAKTGPEIHDVLTLLPLGAARGG